MKKIIIISVILICIGLGYKFLYQKEDEVEREVYVLTESHYHLYEDYAQASIAYFTNDEDFSIIDETTVGYIYNEEVSIKFILSGFKETKMHTEVYNGQQFYGKRIWFKLPMINDTYTLENMYIELDNLLTRYKFYVGTMHVAYFDEINQFDFRTLEGKQGDNYTLNEIIVGVNQLNDIEKIKIGPYEATFRYDDLNLIITLPSEIYLLSETYVLIYFEGKVQYLPQFKFFFSYELLNSGHHHKYLI